MSPDSAAELAADEPREPGHRDVDVTVNRDGSGTITIDGEEIRGVSAIAIDAQARPRSADVELRFTTADRVRFTGLARATVDDDTAAALRLLGWTPPPDEDEPGQRAAELAGRARAVAHALVESAVVTLIAGDRDLDDDPGGHSTGGHL